jgi:hypothetical protein
LPLYFTWGLEDPARSTVPVYQAGKDEVKQVNVDENVDEYVRSLRKDKFQ